MSETHLQITKENALKAYNEGSDGDRALLTRLFPGKLEKKPIMERVTTIEEACTEKGIDTDILFSDCQDDYEKAEVAIKLFAEVMREGKSPKDCFYYPYFYKQSGGGFSFHGVCYDIDCTRASVPASAWILLKKQNTWASVWNHFTKLIYLENNKLNICYLKLKNQVKKDLKLLL